MTTAAFNEFGHIPDIVCMDHYTMFAPNCIEWTGSLRKAQMEEAIEYTMLLKENTEPVRMWTWTQLCAEVWGRPPIPWGIDYQFWGQVMCGAKGMLWFVYGPGRENKFPAQIQKGEEIIRRLGPIRSLCYYGEPVNNVKTSDRRIIARSLVTEDTLIVIAINDNCSNTGLTFHSAFRISPVHTSLTVSLPSWITPETVAYVSKDGELRAANCSQNKGDISFGDVVFDEEPRIYLIGKKDIQPPQKVTGLNAVSMANNDVALTWKEPYDNYGIRGYTVYRNSRRIDDTPYPVYVASGKNQDDTVTFAVQPFDASGNRGPMSDPVTVRKAP
jgi:hypothetical protein